MEAVSHLDLTRAMGDVSAKGSGANPLSGGGFRHRTLPRICHFVQDGRMAEAWMGEVLRREG